ncbi:hypothetical protein QTN93_16685 [Sphingomonas aerolata]|uniref:hypothetical protein n=1 Tax=Sphingomonas aerolata TaxID=185951 RepID=UPI0035A73AD3
MADNPEFYRARAEEERRNGDAASLDNVRDRCRRAEKAWDDMASRAERTQTLRAAREAAPRWRAHGKYHDDPRRIRSA